MEEDKNLEQNLDKSNEKLHISDVSGSDIVITKTEFIDFLIEYKGRVRANCAGINTTEWDWNEKSINIRRFLGW